ncbi:hypothetical protein ACFV9C_22535 [Kribbella sp. NPDC059898]|uniref:hypothetical protein n=1 Tax=Kribbella sp. NPDC059898 TaxID=3346995 RepID=UPI003664F616
MQLREFTNAYNAAEPRIRSEGVGAVGLAERALGELLPQLRSAEDRRVATLLIARLPGYAVPVEPPSALMAEAWRKIFELGDRAPTDEAAGIRSLTRALEHLEQNLRDPHRPLEPTETTSARLAGRH